MTTVVGTQSVSLWRDTVPIELMGTLRLSMFKYLAQSHTANVEEAGRTQAQPWSILHKGRRAAETFQSCSYFGFIDLLLLRHFFFEVLIATSQYQQTSPILFIHFIVCSKPLDLVEISKCLLIWSFLLLFFLVPFNCGRNCVICPAELLIALLDYWLHP